MPIDPTTNLCVPFMPAEVSAMQIETQGVRDGSHPQETREKGTNTMRREFLVLWAERYRFCELVLGNTSLFTTAGGAKYVSRLLPHEKYGRHPKKPQIVATKIDSMKGHKLIDEDADGMPRYERCRVGVFYEHVPYNLLEDDEIIGNDEFMRYCIPPGLESSGSETEYTTMPGSTMRYVREDQSGAAEGPKPHQVPIPFNIGFITTTQERKFTLVMLPENAWGPGTGCHDRCFIGELDFQSIHPKNVPYLGTINQYEFQGYPMGTLLFDRVEEKKYRSGLGEGYWWDLTFVFRFRPNGWNWLPYFDTASGSDANGIYFAGTSPSHYYAQYLPDGKSLYNARNWDALTNFGDPVLAP